MTCSYCDTQMEFVKEETDADKENFFMITHMKCPRCPTTASFKTIVPRPYRTPSPLTPSPLPPEWIFDDDLNWHCAER